MSDGFKIVQIEEASGESQGFFGAERARLTEEIDPGIWGEIEGHLTRNPGGPERLVPLLHTVQTSLGYLPFAVQEFVADKLGLSPIQVFGVVSFYRCFTTTPRGRHRVKVCTGTACFVRRARELVEAAERELGVSSGGVTEDRSISLEQVHCIGACGLAPAAALDHETLGNLTAESLCERLRWFESQVRDEEEEDLDNEEDDATRDGSCSEFQDV